MLSVLTIVKFLLFNADATKQIAGSRMATWVGLLLVFSAGLAREYDGEYLVAEPWHLLTPVAASLIACFFMVLLIYGVAWSRNSRDVRAREVFRSFLNLFWMTAPLAWLYAIPFERFLEPAAATNANLTLLGIVAVWRVALMVRSVQVLYNCHPVAALFPVMLFSDVLSMVALSVVPGPVFMIMGGVRLTENENIILGARIWMVVIGYGTFLFWLIGCFTILCRSSSWRFFKEVPGFVPSTQSVSRCLWGLVAVSLAVWIPVLPFTQKEQWLGWKSERLVRNNDFAGFSKLTQRYSESDFPPHWNPPPRVGYGETRPYSFEVVSGLKVYNGSDWVIAIYAKKFNRNLEGWRWMPYHLERFTDEELAGFVYAISKLPNSVEISVSYESAIDQMRLEKSLEFSVARRTALERLAELGKAGQDHE